MPDSASSFLGVKPAQPIKDVATKQPAQNRSASSFLGTGTGQPAASPIESYDGVQWSYQSNFLSASNDQERSLVLEAGKKQGLWTDYGHQPVVAGVPSAGEEWWVMQNGKKTAVINPFDPVKTGSAQFMAHPFESIGMTIASLVPEFRAAGAIKTGVLEGANAWQIAKYVLKRIGTGSAYNLVRAAMVGIGAGVGQGIDDTVKWFQGYWSGSTEDEKARLLHAAMTGTLAEIIPRALGSGVKTLSGGYAPLLPGEHKALMQSVLSRNLTPGLEQATKGKSILGAWEQSLIETIFGGPLQKQRNMEAMKVEMRKQLLATGMTGPQADAALLSVLNSVHARIDRDGVNTALRQRANQIVSELTADVHTMRQGLDQTLSQQLADLDTQIGSPDPATQERVQQGLIAARIRFGQDMDVLYSKVDDIVARSETPIVVAAQPVKDVASAVLRELPRDQDGKIIFQGRPELGGVMRDIMNLPAFIDFKTAQKIRKALYDAGAYKNLTASREAVLMNQVGDAIDAAFDQVPFTHNTAEHQAAVAALRAADAAWRDGIGRFQGLRVRQLVKDAESGLIKEPETIAGLIFQKQYKGEAIRIMSLLRPDAQAIVQAAYWSRLKDLATSGGELDAKRFRDNLLKEGDMLETAFGPAKAAAMRQFADRNAALAGKLDPATLTSDNFMSRLQVYESEHARLQETLKSNYISMLLSKGADAPEAIRFMLAEPGRIREAKQFYGATSPQWRAIQQHAMSELFAQGLQRTESLDQAIFHSGTLSAVLARISDPELTELFGPDHAKDLRRLAKDIDLVTARPNHRATGAFAIASLILHPFRHLPKLVGLAAWGSVFASPWFVRWLSLGMQESTQRNLLAWGHMGKIIAYFVAPWAYDNTFGQVTQQ
jgi:hypothetical protein